MDKQLDNLERQLRELLEAHETMLTLLRRKREAVRHAAPAVVSECTERENECVKRIGAIESSRQQGVAELTRMFEPGATEPLRLAELAERLPEPRRGRLLVLHQQLKGVMEQVRREAAVTRRAMDGLLSHVQGMVQMVVQTVGGGGTYGRRGRVTPAAAVVSSFSTTV